MQLEATRVQGNLICTGYQLIIVILVTSAVTTAVPKGNIDVTRNYVSLKCVRIIDHDPISKSLTRTILCRRLVGRIVVLDFLGTSTIELQRNTVSPTKEYSAAAPASTLCD